MQQKLVPLWTSIEAFNQEEQTIVVVPSLEAGAGGSIIQAYEERYLFLLLLLRQPRARLIYVTSQAILSSVIDYYLDLLPGVIPSQARPRLFTPSPLDGSSRPLAEKLLDRPRLLERIRSLIPDPDRAHLVPYRSTEQERDLALELGIPMYAADPGHFHLGTKSGCRRLFAEEGVPHPLGHEDLRSLEDVATALMKMRAEKPELLEAIVKLDEGAAGSGNAVVDLRGLPRPGHPEERSEVEARVRGMRFESEAMTMDQFESALPDGGIVEERIAGAEVRSPSVQLRVTPLGRLELLSTHDQLLGGMSGQTYLGARFPADAAYAAAITREAAKVGARLAHLGVLGRFAIDFVVVRTDGGRWEPYAIELNLRKGGTTHPFLTLQFLTDGVYDPEAAEFTAPSGRTKCFVASDHVESPSYRGLTPDDLFDIAVRHGLHFDQSRQTGVVFHMMSALPEHGQTGLTAVGDSPEEADAIYRRVVDVLDEESRTSYQPRSAV